MKTIKIIDLLNKIANGEEVPKKIKYIGYIFEYDTNHERYEAYIDGEICTLNEYVNINDSLNDEVKIIEEKKILEENKIPEKIFLEDMYAPNVVKAIDMELENKINEIIDYLKSE